MPVEIEGIVLNAETTEPIPFANVILMDTMCRVNASTATDFDGKFKLEDKEPKQAKLLKVSALGFELFEEKQPFEQGTMPVLSIPKDFPSNMPIKKIPKDFPSNMPVAGDSNDSPTDSLMVKMIRKLRIE